MQTEHLTNVTRRQFLHGAAALGAAAILADSGGCHAQGTDTIKVGLVGCGGRGIGAVVNAIESQQGKAIQIIALGDLFKGRILGEDLRPYGGEKLDSAVNRITAGITPKGFNAAEIIKVTPETCFDGWDAYKKVIESGINYVILATPPAFRPMMMQYAVEKGVNVFMEKPVCTDFPGGLKVIEAGKLAAQKGLAVVAGTQRRHEAHYVEYMKRLHDGQIGELVAGQCYWMGGTLWYRGTNPAWTPMENQCRNWIYHTWLSGDHIAEQHVHNIDVMNWAMGGPPKYCVGTGGRLVRTDPKYGNVYDHFACEFEYPNGARVASYCQQIAGAVNRVQEVIVGTTGKAFMVTGAGSRILSYKLDERGKMTEVLRSKSSPNPYVQEHADLIASIRANQPLNEAETIANSCLTAAMGRMAAYTGKRLKFEALLAKSKRSLMPEKLEFGPAPERPVALPGGKSETGDLKWYLS